MISTLGAVDSSETHRVQIDLELRDSHSLRDQLDTTIAE